MNYYANSIVIHGLRYRLAKLSKRLTNRVYVACTKRITFVDPFSQDSLDVVIAGHSLYVPAEVPYGHCGGTPTNMRTRLSKQQSSWAEGRSLEK